MAPPPLTRTWTYRLTRRAVRAGLARAHDALRATDPRDATWVGGLAAAGNVGAGVAARWVDVVEQSLAGAWLRSPLTFASGLALAVLGLVLARLTQASRIALLAGLVSLAVGSVGPAAVVLAPAALAALVVAGLAELLLRASFSVGRPR